MALILLSFEQEPRMFCVSVATGGKRKPKWKSVCVCATVCPVLLLTCVYVIVTVIFFLFFLIYRLQCLCVFIWQMYRSQITHTFTMAEQEV